METRPVFQNISPLDHRYSVSEHELFEKLSFWLSEEASVKACVRAEIALVHAHLTVRGRLTEDQRTALASHSDAITAAEVYAEEEKTRHHIRALVNVVKRHLPPEAACLAHLGATSADILDTAFSYRLKAVFTKVLIPLLCRLETLLCETAEKEAATPQVGRTHGQHAIPITVGFMFAEYVSRLGKSILQIKERAAELKGKLAGAVGAYNALSMITDNPEELERAYLAVLGLEPSEHSTQLVEPEYLLRLLLECNTAFGVIANLADDLRHLQRSEIAEIREDFADEQVGSSTMPQKRNPWNSEHVKSLWKTFMPRSVTFFMDQISEHQRDLTNSASQRFVAEYLTGFAFAANRMCSIIQGLRVDRERLYKTLAASAASGALLAEPAYILLAESGQNDAHEQIRRITLKSERENSDFAQALASEPAALAAIERQMRRIKLIPPDETALDFFSAPERYCGLAAKKARELAAKYRKLCAGTAL